MVPKKIMSPEGGVSCRQMAGGGVVAVEMGGQCGAGKETVCTTPRSKREGMCWTGKISEGQRD